MGVDDAFSMVASPIFYIEKVAPNPARSTRQDGLVGKIATSKLNIA
jgi:hypothetical protein